MSSHHRPTWDEYGLLIAKAAATRADCTRRLVGAVLMDRHHRILSVGYNGVAPGVPGCLTGACPRGRFSYRRIPGGLGNSGHPVPCIATHAEVNCLDHFTSGKEQWEIEHDLHDATLYVTDYPCPECSVYIARHFPLARVVTPNKVVSLLD